MSKTVWVNEENYSMGWIALRVLNLVANNSIVLPKDLSKITIDDEIIEEIYFYTLCSPEEIVDFFKKLDQHGTPFDSDEDYASYMKQVEEDNEIYMGNPENFNKEYTGDEF